VLDAYIIEEIKKRDEERRRREDASRPRLQIEIDERRRPNRPPERDHRERDDDERDDSDAGDSPNVIRISLEPRR
jgi:hypothetical protein